MNNRDQRRRKRPAGFTLIELLVVITIIGILGSVVAFKFVGRTENAKMAAAALECKTLQQAAMSFYLEQGKHPASLQDLVPKYVDTINKDPWDGEYSMTVQADGEIKVSSANLEAKKAAMGRSDVAVGGPSSR